MFAKSSSDIVSRWGGVSSLPHSVLSDAAGEGSRTTGVPYEGSTVGTYRGAGIVLCWIGKFVIVGVPLKGDAMPLALSYPVLVQSFDGKESCQRMGKARSLEAEFSRVLLVTRAGCAQGLGTQPQRTRRDDKNKRRVK